MSAAARRAICGRLRDGACCRGGCESGWPHRKTADGNAAQAGRGNAAGDGVHSTSGGPRAVGKRLKGAKGETGTASYVGRESRCKQQRRERGRERERSKQEQTLNVFAVAASRFLRLLRLRSQRRCRRWWSCMMYTAWREIWIFGSKRRGKEQLERGMRGETWTSHHAVTRPPCSTVPGDLFLPAVTRLDGALHAHPQGELRELRVMAKRRRAPRPMSLWRTLISIMV